MIDPYELYSDFKALVNTFQGGFYQPQNTFIRAANNISQELWVKWTKESEKSQEARDNLFWALKSNNIIVKKQSSFYGIVSTPSDYGRFASAKIMWEKTSDDKTKCAPSLEVNDGRCIIGSKKKKGIIIDVYDTTITDDQRTEEYYNNLIESDVQLVDEQRWAACLKHLKKNPTMENPKMRQINNVWNVAPREVTVVILSYYVKPEDAIFAYTTTSANIQTGAGDEIIYDQNKSKPWAWPSSVKNEFLWRLGERFGYFTSDQFKTVVAKQEIK